MTTTLPPPLSRSRFLAITAIVLLGLLAFLSLTLDARRFSSRQSRVDWPQPAPASPQKSVP